MYLSISSSTCSCACTVSSTKLMSSKRRLASMCCHLRNQPCFWSWVSEFHHCLSFLFVAQRCLRPLYARLSLSHHSAEPFWMLFESGHCNWHMGQVNFSWLGMASDTVAKLLPLDRADCEETSASEVAPAPACTDAASWP